MPAEGPLVVAVVGPTASGKSELAVRIAESLGGEVVGADAMQLYRGMDIGTAKLSPAERRGIPHHQVDVLDVTDEASVARYQVEARADVDDIRSRGLHPVVAGGSGLYVRAALDHLDIPPTDADVRARLENQAEELGAAAMFSLLAERDPVAAQAIEPRNVRRVVRALEVVEITGRPFSASMPERRSLHPTVTVGLRPPREVLDERIDTRVDRMWEDGLVDEVRGLLPHGIRDGRTASRALGYAQALAEIDEVMTTEEARAETARLTRRYARRQESWFRPDPRTTWFDPTDEGALDEALAYVRRAVADNG
ncbi:tRNA delta(2)-isopentenylpyrophosphate transferase [Knoellia flava TL1]|uniref:tRNA dimethylallyltransferase n=2 Tax=Knoellia flava TaxID=913969 RepID=A0A8H9FQH0_9MICO|nr:tRNA (adenosine(37)-N6)-dimethylallyltransferase MiaA [Knoellia flava]KGN29097.1 tRNA delta(2)-isopentenylpyrophosphate transferase [Knoellia flava TL1]GGB69642.1 tRNA dimethylallyltransferase [Knoellia flava]